MQQRFNAYQTSFSGKVSVKTRTRFLVIKVLNSSGLDQGKQSNGNELKTNEPLIWLSHAYNVEEVFNVFSLVYDSMASQQILISVSFFNVKEIKVS